MIKFLTISRLLGENRRITLETPEKEYRSGDRIPIYAHALDDLYQPMTREDMPLRLRGLGVAGGQEVKLAAVPNAPGNYEGFLTLPIAGRYVAAVRDAPEGAANDLEFDVVDRPLELMEPALRADRLRDMARDSGGKYFSLEDLPDLPGAIGGENLDLRIRQTRELWDHWPVFAILVLLLGSEWFLRRTKHLS
jgi:hypothetical protein